MIIRKKDFQELLYIKEFNKNNRVSSDITYIHKYDKQRIKSLLNEQMDESNIGYIFVKDN